MKINKVICVFVVALVLLSGGCVKSGVGKLEVNVGEENLYECSDGSTAKAYFCNLSDDSLAVRYAALEGESRCVRQRFYKENDMYKTGTMRRLGQAVWG